VDFDEILQFMAMDTALEMEDMRLAVERLKKALVFYLAKGDSVETPLGTIAAHVRGIANGSPVTPEISRAGMKLRFRPDRALFREVQSNLAISVEEQMDPKRPRIVSVWNVEDPAAEDQMSTGQLLHISGSRLGFDIEAEDEGLFFVNGDEAGNRVSVYSRHGTRIIDCKVPEVPPGEYALQLRSRPGKGSELRTGTYSNTVTVS
jgi:hypothetical protein